MKFVAILSLMVLSACSANQHIDPSFKPYVAQFKSQSFTAGNPVLISALTVRMDQTMSATNSTISTSPTPAPLVTCVLGTTTTDPEVLVNPDFWNNKAYSNAAREQVLFRELARCTIGATHDDSLVLTTDGTQIEKTIMNSHYLSDEKYTVNYKYYMKQLFMGQSLTPPVPVLNGTSQWVDIYLDKNSTETPATSSIEGLAAPLDI